MIRASIIAVIAIVAFYGSQSAVAQDKENPLLAQIKASVKNHAKPFTLIVNLKVKKGKNKQFETAFAKAIVGTNKEKGNIVYQLNRDTKDSSKYVVYERWRNVKAIAFHLETEHIKTLVGQLDALLEGPPEFHVLTPAGE